MKKEWPMASYCNEVSFSVKRNKGVIVLMDGCSGNPDLKGDERAVLCLITDFDGIAADFAVLDITLEAARQVQQHGDALTTVGAGKDLLPCH
jgi:hypothetical protein